MKWTLKSALWGVAMLSAPAWAGNLGHPGAVNYVEGQVALDGQPLGVSSVGSAQMGLGQTLETQHGKAEVLLTPGVFLRLGDASTVRMDSDGLTDTRVAILRGEAMLEVDLLFPQNNLQVAENSATVSPLKKGLYAFNAGRSSFAVYDGEAKVVEGDHSVTVKKGKEVSLAGPAPAKVAFDRNAHDALYNWSDVRSEYLSQAAIQSANTYVAYPTGWFGSGWYWNSWYGMYSFLPGDGFFYSPFGWGFFSPRYVGYAPVGGYRGGIVARGGLGNRTGALGAAGLTRGFSTASHGGGFGGRR